MIKRTPTTVSEPNKENTTMTVEECVNEFVSRMVSAGISLEEVHDFVNSYYPDAQEESES